MRYLKVLVVALVVFASNTAVAQTPVVVTSGVHEGVWTRQNVEWTSKFDPGYLPARRGSSQVQWRLDLAKPLPAGASVRSQVASTTIEPVRNGNGEIVALDLRAQSTSVSTDMVTSIPLGDSIDPPLARNVVQRVEVVGATVRPVPGSPLELRLADVRHVELDSSDRQFLVERWGRPQSPRPIVLIADESFVASGGLTPNVRVEDHTAVFVTLAVALGFILLVLVVGVRLVGRHVRHEEASAYLREHEPSLADL